MPKGEHFKKENPRIHQVSFKLNASELEDMKKLIAASGKSLPQFFRDLLFTDQVMQVQETTVKVETPKEEKKATPPKPEPKKDTKTNQFSLF